MHFLCHKDLISFLVTQTIFQWKSFAYIITLIDLNMKHFEWTIKCTSKTRNFIIKGRCHNFHGYGEGAPSSDKGTSFWRAGGHIDVKKTFGECLLDINVLFNKPAICVIYRLKLKNKIVQPPFSALGYFDFVLFVATQTLFKWKPIT